MKREISRRDFIKTGTFGLLGAMAVSAAVPSVLRTFAAEASIQKMTLDQSGVKGHTWRFVVDLTKCIGCGRCVRACKLENNVPLEPEYNRTWVERYVISDSEEVYVDSPDAGINGFTPEYMNLKYQNLSINKSFFVPKLCNQCNKPPCVSVCPVGATYATKEGAVLVDRKACIGCRYCIQACPYGARFLDPRFKVVDKCTWCYHRVTKGLPPVCVEVCPVGARMFGDISDRDSAVSKVLKQSAFGVLKPELGTEPMVYYIGLQKGVH